MRRAAALPERVEGRARRVVNAFETLVVTPRAHSKNGSFIFAGAVQLVPLVVLADDNLAD
jgi:hypothetical protein